MDFERRDEIIGDPCYWSDGDDCIFRAIIILAGNGGRDRDFFFPLNRFSNCCTLPFTSRYIVLVINLM